MFVSYVKETNERTTPPTLSGKWEEPLLLRTQINTSPNPQPPLLSIKKSLPYLTT
jgi:hypothetical protein